MLKNIKVEQKHTRTSQIFSVKGLNTVYGMRTADVARAIKCNVRTVRHLRQHYRETGRIADRPHSGRPRVTTPAQDQYI